MTGQDNLSKGFSRSRIKLSISYTFEYKLAKNFKASESYVCVCVCVWLLFTQEIIRNNYNLPKSFLSMKILKIFL
jgi:hypothetical protein